MQRIRFSTLLQWMTILAATTTNTTNTTTTIGTQKPSVSATSTRLPVVTTTVNNFREKCYEYVGCFNNSAPFNNDEKTLPLAPEKIGVEFRLFTRKNEEYEKLTYKGNDVSVKNSHFNSSRRTRVIIHGFQNNVNEQWMADIKDSLLLIEDSNVIIVGWGPGANGGYDSAVANLRVVAAELSLLLIRLVKEAGLKLKDVHLIGHSLGAHTSGDTGRRLGGQIGRITGMDPAGPDFLNYNKAVLLDKTDAMFVDNIHTNGKTLLEGGAGISTPTAHVDFFVNGGRTQPGCKDGLSGFFSGGVAGVACSHGRSHQLFLESIRSECPFTAYPCANQSEFSLGKCLDCEPGGCSEMGFYADQHKARGSRFINTRAKAPFCGFHYAVTIHAGHGDDTKGTIYVTLRGSWGNTDAMMVTESEEKLKSGEDYVGVVVSPNEVGNVQSITVKYNKYKGWLFGLGSGNTVFAVDAVDVLSGESGKQYTFCLPTRQLTHSQSATLPVSPSGEC
ncbi:pancreatic lipase-related protein 2-like isoform X2 [Littorina saxatilis]|uniref:pancreatic lipase-related protein 2-like isoform X2 n=1 Tax=Littorina saxatilis TaxID=31220 RepID=UPI0038B530DC